MKYRILQIKDLGRCKFAFERWKYAKEDFDINEYKEVYSGNIEHEDMRDAPTIINYLEHLYYVFNCEQPLDYEGHSLSVSDVVELDGKLYYCDSAGWELIEK